MGRAPKNGGKGASVPRGVRRPSPAAFRLRCDTRRLSIRHVLDSYQGLKRKPVLSPECPEIMRSVSWERRLVPPPAPQKDSSQTVRVSEGPVAHLRPETSVSDQVRAGGPHASGSGGGDSAWVPPPAMGPPHPVTPRSEALPCAAGCAWKCGPRELLGTKRTSSCFRSVLHSGIAGRTSLFPFFACVSKRSRNEAVIFFPSGGLLLSPALFP